MKIGSIRVLLGMAALVVAQAAGASIIHFTAALDGASESPVNASAGIGVVTVDVDTVLNTLFVSATFSGLGGTTTASHIHCCTTIVGSGTAGIATTTPSFPGFPLGVTSGTFSMTYDLLFASSYNPAFVTASGGTIAAAEASLIAGMLAGRTYFNIHTSQFPSGEIRGFLAATPAAVPEPPLLALLAIGALATGWVGRRTRR